MKKIKLKLDELKSPQVLTAKQLKSIMGAAANCYTDFPCGDSSNNFTRGRCGTFTLEGNIEICKCQTDTGYYTGSYDCGQ